MKFKDIPSKYRPIPFWSWNSKLETEETVRQIRLMKECGMGGFFMHARGGLATEYMGEEWFDNVTASVDEAKKLDMRAWAYDENGWPSGFGDGKVNGLGVKFQQKYLRMETEENHKETAICKCGEYFFYYDINPFYVDVLDKTATDLFLSEIYDVYYKRYGNEIEGFFTDEPQVSRNGMPWSFVFEDEYKARYGENILDKLDELFLEKGDYKKTRFNFWKMVADLFSTAYMKNIYDWCSERGLKLTGHLSVEEDLFGQITANGAAMPHYEYFHIPGVDWLGREMLDSLTARQVGSVGAQMNKESVLVEIFGLCGNNVSFGELKALYEWHMVRGINLMCQHLEAYSMKGIRKRDYPPSMYYQQPWWDDYKTFIDAMSGIGKLLAEGKEETSVLLIHPLSLAWTLYNDKDREKIDALNELFLKTVKTLEKKHIEFHLGDETIMERHACVENGAIVIGDFKYDKVILLSDEVLFDSTRKLLSEFASCGGKIVTADEIGENSVIDNPEITYAKRIFDDCTVHYFVNSTKKEQKAVLGIEGRALDILGGELVPLAKNYTFEPLGSLIVVEDGTKAEAKEDASPEIIYPDGAFKISGKVQNSLLLDKCDYYFDGVLQEKNAYVLNIAERANALGRAVKLHQDYRVKIDYIPESLHLVTETPEKFEISINGTPIDKTVCGTFVDYSFKRIEIAKYLKYGENVISFDCNFVQSEEFYDNLKRAYEFEGEKNKLSYDIEIEAVYLVGEFAVKTDGEWTALERNARRYSGEFVISAPKRELRLSDIQEQGFPFFSGGLTVEKEIEIGDCTVLKFDRKGINVIRVSIDGRELSLLWGKDEINLSALASCGKHTLRLTLVNNLRNLLGPHHLEIGESYQVAPGSFYKEKCVWKDERAVDIWGLENLLWNEDYSFVRMGII